MLFTMAVSLYTSRVNLSVLGIEDNGIYQIVGGLVATFAFLNSSLAGATSRFLTYELGKGNIKRLKNVFAASLNIHIYVAVLILLLSETLGLWWLECKMVIPEDRMTAARVVYHISVIVCMINITQVPYNASIISHEKMNVFAYMSILEVLLKLLICYLLFVLPFDKLMSYGVLTLLVAIIVQSTYRVYCIKHFEECHFRFIKDREILMPILKFSGWDLFGNFSVMARTQGVNIIMNLFYGPAINAASGFAASVGNAIYGFANNFMTAVRPPIVKAYSVNKLREMESLMINASKYSFVLMLLLTTPFIFESSFIIKVWLKNPPEYTAVFSVLELLLSSFSTLFLPLVFAIHATGNIKFMSIVNGSIWFLTLPITYIMLRLGFNPQIPYIVKIILLCFVIISNIYSVKKLIPEFRIKNYIKKSIVPSIISLVIVVLITYIVYSTFKHDGWARFIVVTVTSTVCVICLTIFLIMTKENRNNLQIKLKKLRNGFSC